MKWTACLATGWRLTVWALGVVAATACGGNGEPFRVAGTVHGLWDGSDGVVLRLTANGVDTLRTVSNGTFELLPALADGDPYTLEVAYNPFAHLCHILDGGAPTSRVIKFHPEPFEIACIGPSVGITASAGRDAWQLDPTRDSQTFAGSVFDAEVQINVSAGVPLASLTIDGERIDGDSVVFSRSVPVGSRPLEVRFATTTRLSKTYTITFERGGAPAAQVAYGKARAGATSHAFGTAVAIDGDTLVVGAAPDLTHAGPLAGAPGAVVVFVRNPDNGSWSQQAELMTPTGEPQDGFGSAVAIAGDTLVVGAPGARQGAGAAYVYTRDLVGSWSLTDTLTDPSGRPSELGSSLAMQRNEIVVGAPFDDSDPSGGDAAVANGAVHVFRWAGGWQHAATIKPARAPRGLTFGASVALADDTLVVGAPEYAIPATEPPEAQAVYVFRGRDDSWHEEQRIAPSRVDLSIGFGLAVAVSGDTLAIGAPFETGTSAGIDGPETASVDQSSGAVYTYTRSAGAWTREAYIKSSAPGYGDQLGASVALVGDVLAVGAPGESNLHADGTHADNGAPQSGAVLVFGRGDAGWRQVGYHKAANVSAEDRLGFSVALSDRRLVVGAPLEDGGGSGVPAGGADGDGGPDTGAFYIFE